MSVECFLKFACVRVPCSFSFECEACELSCPDSDTPQHLFCHDLADGSPRVMILRPTQKLSRTQSHTAYAYQHHTLARTSAFYVCVWRNIVQFSRHKGEAVEGVGER